MPNGASQTLWICKVFQNCNNQLSGKKVPVLFNKASSKCSELVKIETRCVDNVNDTELSYSCKYTNYKKIIGRVYVSEYVYECEDYKFHIKRLWDTSSLSCQEFRNMTFIVH